jgi:hypothetical protein
MSTSAAAQGGLRSGHQESPDSGVSSYEDVQVPEREEPYDEDSKHDSEDAEPEEGEETGTLQDEAMSDAS